MKRIAPWICGLAIGLAIGATAGHAEHHANSFPLKMQQLDIDTGTVSYDGNGALLLPSMVGRYPMGTLQKAKEALCIAKTAGVRLDSHVGGPHQLLFVVASTQDEGKHDYSKVRNVSLADGKLTLDHANGNGTEVAFVDPGVATKCFAVLQYARLNDVDLHLDGKAVTIVAPLGTPTFVKTSECIDEFFTNFLANRTSCQ